jgi:hypothetical protein
MEEVTMIRKFLFLTTIVFFSSTTLAQKNYCVTHAQCQNLTDESTACYLVDTGDENCQVKCYRVFVGSYCKFEDGKSYGTCAEENYKQAKLEPNKKNCKNAIPQQVMEEVFVL